MAKVITFAQHFPAGHPRAGQPTCFVQKIYHTHGMDINDQTQIMTQLYLANKHKIDKGDLHISDLQKFWKRLCSEPLLSPKIKCHTVRSGSRWKVGDKASLRVWSGKPYDSPQIHLFQDDRIIQGVWPIIKEDLPNYSFESWEAPTMNSCTTIKDIAQNDGLTLQDFFAWFPKPFSGQIISWHKIDY